MLSTAPIDHIDVSSYTIPTDRPEADGTLVIADGYSCREQIAQATGERPLHLAQVLVMALPSSTTREEAP